MLYVVVTPHPSSPSVYTLTIPYIHFRQTGSPFISLARHVRIYYMLYYLSFSFRHSNRSLWFPSCEVVVWRGCWVDHWMSIIMLYSAFSLFRNLALMGGVWVPPYPRMSFFLFLFSFLRFLNEDSDGTLDCLFVSLSWTFVELQIHRLFFPPGGLWSGKLQPAPWAFNVCIL